MSNNQSGRLYRSLFIGKATSPLPEYACQADQFLVVVCA